MQIADFIAMLEEIAPPELAEEFDGGRIGHIIEGHEDVTTVCCALDATLRVVRAAVAEGADMLVVHHTPIWDPLTRIGGESGRIIGTALAGGLNVYVMHTNFDHAPGGINDALAETLHLTGVKPLSLGVIGTLTHSLDEVAEILGAPLRVYGDVHVPCRLAVGGGSCFSADLIREAEGEGAEAFLSAELKHSVMRSSGISLIESTHYATEAPGMRMFAERMGWTFIEDIPALVQY
ncbi:Nif3-like dinuclear metal center hexameric protein [Methanogenium organophilum]|uniref:Nif3-like dinuclear metal center hexameric protein n=1 Tax=Methanogenium organophilum TaxID=2199 RepID=A0A9X9S4T9_METOG|nr:Nif3-like dinuclear metal center hexameric protein [Methanogenium organophilum]WAI01483.1 Nif3-like dinuclear metal center hexameric protein [Methanogenium organophilum]